MKYINDFKGWRSEEIVKVFLLSLNIFDLSESYTYKDKGVDLIARCKKDIDFKFGVEIKATKYSRSIILSKYKRKDYDVSLPIIQFFINYDKETGYFRILNQENESTLERMTKKNFKEAMKNYAQQCI